MAGNDSFTKALLHFDGNLNDDNFGGSAHSWSATGAAAANGTAKFGADSLQVLNTAGSNQNPSQWISTAHKSDLYLGSGEWTIDFWASAFAVSSVAFMCGEISSSGFGATYSWAFEEIIFFGSQWQVRFLVTDDGTPSSNVFLNSGALDLNQFYHIAAVSDGTTVRLFINGVLADSDAAVVPFDSGRDLVIGAVPNTGLNFTGFRGLIDEFRLSVGVARWTSDFTPPTTAYGGAIAQAVSVSCTTSASIVTPHPIRAVLASIAIATSASLRKSALKLISILSPALLSISLPVARIVRAALYTIRGRASSLDKSRSASDSLQKSRSNDPTLTE